MPGVAIGKGMGCLHIHACHTCFREFASGLFSNGPVEGEIKDAAIGWAGPRIFDQRGGFSGTRYSIDA
jgi:hypothetical protein